MARLIDADALNVSDIFCSYDTVTDLIDVEVWIDKAPTIDAEPVRHGRWIVSEDEYGICATEFTCSNCKESYCTSELTDEEFLKSTHYCPNCGAKMDGSVSE